jgi:putative phosphoribosyl transferase
MGAIASGGVFELDPTLIERLGIGEHELRRAVAAEERELERRDAAYRGSREPPALRDTTVVLVDDGLATGATMRAAALAVREHDPARVVVAVPVASPQTCEQVQEVADEVVCSITPRPLRAVGLWYEDFSPTTDEEVRELLARAGAAGPSS